MKGPFCSKTVLAPVMSHCRAFRGMAALPDLMRLRGLRRSSATVRAFAARGRRLSEVKRTGVSNHHAITVQSFDLHTLRPQRPGSPFGSPAPVRCPQAAAEGTNLTHAHTRSIDSGPETAAWEHPREQRPANTTPPEASGNRGRVRIVRIFLLLTSVPAWPTSCSIATTDSSAAPWFRSQSHRSPEARCSTSSPSTCRTGSTLRWA